MLGDPSESEEGAGPLAESAPRSTRQCALTPAPPAGRGALVRGVRGMPGSDRAEPAPGAGGPGPGGRPDPADATDVTGFVLALRRLRIWAGSPSLAVLQRRTGLPRTTIHDSLHVGRSTLPSLDFVRRFAAACGCDQDVAQRWEAGWRRLKEGMDCPEWVADRAGTPLPRQLPAAPRLFVGRAGELATLTAALGSGRAGSSPARVAVITGTGGIGKSWLATRWAHDQVETFPDGQLYIDLHGFDPLNEPTAPDAAIHALLVALGVEPGSVPTDPDARIGLYRSLVAGRRMLVLLDNARDTNQVIPLLPGSPGCAVLVTSRAQLAGLISAHGAVPVPLGVLDELSARRLLAHQLGPARIDAEPAAAAVLLDWCAGLPLALGILTARVAGHPTFPLSALADELRDASARLDGLDTGDLATSLRSVFSCSYRALSPAAAELSALLGIAPGGDISLSAAAALIARPVARTRVVLRELVTANLLAEHAPGRYRAHDLVRLYAAERAHRLPPEAVDAPLRRLTDFYLHTAFAGDRLIDPRRPPITLARPADGCQPAPLSDQQTAMRWFSTEHDCLHAVQEAAVARGWHVPGWQLAWTLANYHRLQGHRWPRVTVCELALAATRKLGRSADQALAHRLLGHAYAGVGRHREAVEHLRRALDMFCEAGDLLGQAHTHHAFGWAWGQQGDDEQALCHATRALSLFDRLGEPAWTAGALNCAGWYLARLGRHGEARLLCHRALRLCRTSGYAEGEAYTLDSLGYIAARLGQCGPAVRRYERALARFRDLGNAVMEADVLAALGPLYRTTGRAVDACRAWQRAERLFAAQGRVEQWKEALAQLDALLPPAARTPREACDAGIAPA